ncbi:hypothetical protein RO3G_15004 [Rhizopus delemar RA 99-880]|uniref:Uncharacterized protein n=1 Tax=Rhizopus delemar (strain RA 99-880 / ATCC MYA-4621 / FGSC 9543 / NRRL 43880) TaxID=246409 RepID=I1CPB3_RHIO9|nr:hypothetical protein RO3G_15004 [Rhizopus delemar RA 99-880]|eukprot:EIE90293.1 hypothetical protein RO3G_15004 [Rhizopus delemar RA 99-880]
MSNHSVANLVSHLPVQNSNGTALEDVTMNYDGDCCRTESDHNGH